MERHWDWAGQLADLAARVADLSRENARLAACHAEVCRERDQLAAELATGQALEQRIAALEAAAERWEQERRRGAEQLLDLLVSERDVLRARVASLEEQLAAVVGGTDPDLTAPAEAAYPEFGNLVAAIDATITRLGSTNRADRRDDSSSLGR